jgi:hypothetical protein
MSIASLLSPLLSSLPQRTINLDPAVPVVGRMLGDLNLSQSMKTLVDVVDSSPFVNVSLISLKSAPHAYFGDKGLVKQFDNGVKCRLRYLESAVTSLAAIVYNVVFGAVFSLLSLVTLGKVKTIADEMRKQWTHLALAMGSFGISCAGTFNPKLGITTNLSAALAIGTILLQVSETGAVTRICSAYQRHAAALKQSVAQACAAQGYNYDLEFAPLFQHLDRSLNPQRVQTYGDLIGAIAGAAQQLPRNMLPSVSLDCLRHAVRLSISRNQPARTTG